MTMFPQMLFVLATVCAIGKVAADDVTVYPIVTSGTCADNGFDLIGNAAACGAAAGQVGWSDTDAQTTSSSDPPRGCFDISSSSSGGDLYFSTNTGSTRSCDYWVSKACLCAFTGPACAHGGGATANPTPCVCGASGACTSATGLFCDASSSTCSGAPVDCAGSFSACDANCEKTYTVQTPAAYGGTDCAYDDGDKADCTADECVAPVDVAPGDCVGSFGACDANCEKTYTVHTPAAHGGTDCAYDNGDKADCTGDACVVTCANTDGTAANPANCACGTADCDAAYTGLFCFADDNRCRFAPCATTDGTAANPANCACGTTDCNAAYTGLFCTSSLSSCSSFVACANTDGTAANPANCACGTADCVDASTGLFCDAAKNQCDDVPTCATTDGTAANPANCACGTTDCNATPEHFTCAELLGEFETSCNRCTSGASTSTLPYECVEVQASYKASCGCDSEHSSNDASSLLKTTAHPFCDISGGRNSLGACNAIANCANTDGTVASDSQCKCGSNTCNPGQACSTASWDNSYCYWLQCQNTNGTAPHKYECECVSDDSPCGEDQSCLCGEVGLYCNAKINPVENNRCSSNPIPDCATTGVNEDRCVCGSLLCDAGRTCEEGSEACSAPPVDCDGSEFVVGRPYNNDQLRKAVTCFNKTTADTVPNDWDVSQVTDMSQLFFNGQQGPPSDFNEDISGWDVSQVTTMSYMFTATSEFNQDISGWDVSSVTDMSAMFGMSSAFNIDISDWDVSGVTSATYMFYAASAFNQILCGDTWKNNDNMVDEEMVDVSMMFPQSAGSIGECAGDESSAPPCVPKGFFDENGDRVLGSDGQPLNCQLFNYHSCELVGCSDNFDVYDTLCAFGLPFETWNGTGFSTSYTAEQCETWNGVYDSCSAEPYDGPHNYDWPSDSDGVAYSFIGGNNNLQNEDGCRASGCSFTSTDGCS